MIRQRQPLGNRIAGIDGNPLVPDIQRLLPQEYSLDSPQPEHGPQAAPPGTSSFEDVPDLNMIVRRQYVEDIEAYHYDLEFCSERLLDHDLTPEEIRKLQIRIFDASHQIRYARHHLERMHAQPPADYPPTASMYKAPAQAYGGAGLGPRSKRTYTQRGSLGVAGNKRQRTQDSEVEEASVVGGGGAGAGERAPSQDGGAAAAPESSELSSINVAVRGKSASGGGGGRPSGSAGGSPETPVSSAMQRKGWWTCRLCTSQKYLNSGQNRMPSMPIKWPLRDMSKTVNHFLHMHVEHSPEERCRELGDALDKNRGPFEYWLTQTRSQHVEDSSVIDGFIETLREGQLPDGLRGLNRAAAVFPNSLDDVRGGGD
ncbi:hypothetical protein F4780DRAFT_538686 [Xylariomycetidae sp. FL0641]|nr:hypothetical protein F4780DRAFT_538686 [Xylariomycetidae sp. FL0641]